MNQISQKIAAWIFILLLMINLAAALGIRPAKTTIISNEVDVSELDGIFWVVNDGGREFTTSLYVEGEMSEYVTLKEQALTFRADDDAKAVEFKINMPDEIPPGVSTAVIVVEEKLGSNEPQVISSKVILKHKVYFQGSYPDKYIEAKLNFHENGEEIEFISEVTNLGKKDINKILTTFYVNDKQQEKHALESAEETLERKENKLLKAKIEKDVFELGEFEVSAVTKFDGQQIEIVKKMRVGKPDVEVAYFDKYFVAHKINEYTLELLNNWNTRLENVFVDVLVMKNNQQIDEFRTRSTDIEGLLREKIKDYYDARERDEGSYRFDLEVNFWNSIRMEQNKQSFDIELLISEDFEDLSGNTNALTGGAVSTGGLSGGVILWIIIIILSSLIASYIGYRYKNRDKYDGDQL